MSLLQSEAFPFGEGLFETFPVFDGTPAFFAAHWNRLRRSCDALGYPFPFSMEEIREKIAGASAAVVRLSYRLESGAPRLFIQSLAGRPAEARRRLLPAPVSPHPLAAHKVTARQAYEKSHEEAKRSGWDDALLFAKSGEILETTRANFFFVARGTVFTPPADGKILPGIVRAWLLENAPVLQVAVEETRMTAGDLFSADEVFITNSVIGIAPVAEISGLWKDRGAAAGGITEKLSEFYSNAAKI